MWRPSGLSALCVAACLGLALCSSVANAEFDFPSANLRSIQRHLVRMGEFFPVNRPGEGDEGFDGSRPENPEGGAISKFAFSNMPSLLGAVYLFSAVCFILCLRGLSTPQTAKRGNILGLVGMVAAVVVTFTESGFGNHYLLFSLAAIPAVGLGLYIAQSVNMTEMPQLVALFHSFVGLAAMLLQAKPCILNNLSKGMNRSLVNVVLGGFEEAEEAGAASPQGDIQQTTADKVADELLAAQRVLIVPGYGMAVARCQSELADIAKNLMNCGISVEFGIHPVAGRMPAFPLTYPLHIGHMNVLLAEADVPYKIVKEMSEVNPSMGSYDVVLVVGANDTVNPAALEAGSKISGMPVIEAWKARSVVVLKRSMAPGYASIENPLFHLSNTKMLFGNAKNTTSAIFARVNAVSLHRFVSLCDANHNPSQKAEGMPSAGMAEDLESGLLEFVREPVSDPSSWPYPRMGVGILRETGGVGMVPIAPKFVAKLRRMAFRVVVEAGAGEEVGFTDEAYRNAGAEVVRGPDAVIQGAEILLRVSPPSPDMIGRIPRDKVLVSYLFPSLNTQALDALARQGVTALALDEVPRVTRAQKLDVKSAMQGLQGYRAVIEAFNALPRLSKSSISAAGRVEAAKVFVIGAGVAGLQAIATAHGLGAQVFAHDVRSTTREEVESCGGKFIGLRMGEEGEVLGGYAREMGEAYQRNQREMIANTIKHCDVVICTAAIYGKPSPKLISRDMLRNMKPGSVVVDLATEFGDSRAGWGGNVEVSPKDDQVVVDGITVIGRKRIESRMPIQASELFSMNVCNLLEDLGGGSNFRINMDDEVIRGLVAVYQGRNVWQPQQPTPARTPPRGQAPPPPSSAPRAAPEKAAGAFAQALASDAFFAMCLVVAAAVVGLLGKYGTALISGYTLLALVGTFLASVNIAGEQYFNNNAIAQAPISMFIRRLLRHTPHAEDVSDLKAPPIRAAAQTEPAFYHYF
ncbi:hypothetical protein Emed_003931 [Eimeria media]